ncbi:hypothetical protein [Geotalea uraniireducens]|uniref:hypothetical protein n=1 Tax=Geotalea uraniireducens TaxID=351604 RepID=UPI0002F7BDD4|nr:hypothetical protein [Geotalea uraniireducens]
MLWQAAPGRFLLDLPDVARFLVESGTKVTIDPSPTAEEADLRRFARMAPLAALCYQRSMLALHAAAVVGPSGAILIAGDSGAGKSTLLAAMLKREWSFLADDLAAVSLAENGLSMVYPAFPELALWSDARGKLAFDDSDTGRHLLPRVESFGTTPQPLRALFRLAVHKGEIELADVTGTRLFDTLTTLSYNSRIADALLERAAFMRQASAIARTVPVRTLRRPRDRWCAGELADLLEESYS